jgi:hypothetical protein
MTQWPAIENQGRSWLNHDGITNNVKKWSEKCDGDRTSLLRIAKSVSCLHLILATSSKHSDLNSSKWQAKWSRLASWQLATTLTYSCPLPEAGAMMLKGWFVQS